MIIGRRKTLSVFVRIISLKKSRYTVSFRQKQLRKQCEQWLHSEEAALLIKQQCKVIKKETDAMAKAVSKGRSKFEDLHIKLLIQKYSMKICRRDRKSCSQFRVQAANAVLGWKHRRPCPTAVIGGGVSLSFEVF